MKNFPVKVDGKEYWISRAVAVCCAVFKIKDNNIYVLTEIRGKGAADFQGKYCMPCGYLDYDETVSEACAREVFEETGMKINDKKLKIISINSDPKEKRQNVTIRFTYQAKEDEDFNTKDAKGGEKDEIEDVLWLKVGNIDREKNKIKWLNLDKTQWAFNHVSLMKKLIKIKNII